MLVVSRAAVLDHIAIGSEKNHRAGRARHDRSCVCISDLPRPVLSAGGTGRLKPPVAPGTPKNFICLIRILYTHCC